MKRTPKTILSAGAIAAFSMTLALGLSANVNQSSNQQGSALQGVQNGTSSERASGRQSKNRSQASSRMSMNANQESHKASDILNKRVENAQGERLGSVEDIIVDVDSGDVSYIVVSSGSVMGLGDDLRAVPPNALKVSGKDRVVLDISRDRWENAPTFEKNSIQELGQDQKAREIRSFYKQDLAASESPNNQSEFGARDTNNDASREWENRSTMETQEQQSDLTRPSSPQQRNDRSDLNSTSSRSSGPQVKSESSQAGLDSSEVNVQPTLGANVQGTEMGSSLPNPYYAQNSAATEWRAGEFENNIQDAADQNDAQAGQRQFGARRESSDIQHESSDIQQESSNVQRESSNSQREYGASNRKAQPQRNIRAEGNEDPMLHSPRVQPTLGANIQGTEMGSSLPNPYYAQNTAATEWRAREFENNIQDAADQSDAQAGQREFGARSESSDIQHESSNIQRESSNSQREYGASNRKAQPQRNIRAEGSERPMLHNPRLHNTHRGSGRSDNIGLSASNSQAQSQNNRSEMAQEYGAPLRMDQSSETQMKSKESRRSNMQAQKSSSDANLEMTSDLMGRKVVDQQQKNIGEITDFLVDLDAGKIDHLIINTEAKAQMYAVPLEQIQVAEESITLEADQQQLDQAPLFEQRASSSQSNQILRYKEQSGQEREFGARPVDESRSDLNARDANEKTSDASTSSESKMKSSMDKSSKATSSSTSQTREDSDKANEFGSPDRDATSSTKKESTKKESTEVKSDLQTPTSPDAMKSTDSPKASNEFGSPDRDSSAKTKSTSGLIDTNSSMTPDSTETSSATATSSDTSASAKSTSSDATSEYGASARDSAGKTEAEKAIEKAKEEKAEASARARASTPKSEAPSVAKP